MATGRPTTYTPELAKFVCDMISTHTCGIKKLTAMYEDFPHSSTIFAWMKYFPAFSSQYFDAKCIQASLLADSLLDLPDEIETYEDEKGVERIDAGMLGKARLRYQINVWHASKLAPKIYGDKLQTEHSVSDSTKEVVKRVADINKENEKDY